MITGTRVLVSDKNNILRHFATPCCQVIDVQLFQIGHIPVNMDVGGEHWSISLANELVAPLLMRRCVFGEPDEVDELVSLQPALSVLGVPGE